MSVTVKNAQKSKKAELTVEERYKKKDLHKHILDIPDTWIGSIQEDDVKMWVYDNDKKIMVNRVIKYIPGLYKIFDEILVNSRDHTVRDKTCTEIRITIDAETGTITVWNNGTDGMPIVWHKEENCYVPTMLFGRIMTSENYDKKGKTVGGKNGVGSKAANIYSKQFTITIIDAKNMLKFTQNFYDNMYKEEEPIIEKLKGKQNSSTQITFTPDYARFGVKKLSTDMLDLFKKRAYDIAAVTNIKVYLNDELIALKSFDEYIKLYYENSELPNDPIYEQPNERWKIGVVFDPNAGYRQMSYVNGISTALGGTHVQHVLDRVVGGLHDIICAKHKALKIKTMTIRDNLTFFIDSVIEDPTFNSQSKEFHNLPVSKFGSRCDLSDDFIKKLAKSGIEDEVVNFANFRANEELKKLSGKKKPRITGLDKLVDAHFAGTRKAKDARIIFTEGDSAKSFAVAGTEDNRNKFGVFPLRGKLLNVREATVAQLKTNEEIKAIIQIIGLRIGKKYTDVNQLRYGGILILTDQDYDGSHIKGLLINFIHHFWPTLPIIDGFIQVLKTPIIVAWRKNDPKKKNKKLFYTISEYNIWKESIGENIKLWNIKYYKGLGTSTDAEAKEAFADFENKITSFVWDKNKKSQKDNTVEDKDKDQDQEEEEEEVVDENSNAPESADTDEEDDYLDKESKSFNAITLAFAKNRANDRKAWLGNYNKNNILDTAEQVISYDEFINKELIHFSNYDNERSIPSVNDGLKPSLRKILYGSISRGILKEELKVAQLAGYISDKAGYHHGEASLQGAIIAMAQTFVGSNNINILLPNGNFGNRAEGGKNAASARYIYTQLNPLTPLIFRSEDDYVYEYQDDDGTQIEPVTYGPIIPMVLVNGGKGIGTGFSMEVDCTNPKILIKNTRLRMKGKPLEEMPPWYRGFKGSIIKINDKTYESRGIHEVLDEKHVQITELAIGIWTTPYLKFLDTLVADDPKKPEKGKILKSIRSDCGNNTINITVEFLENQLQTLIKKNELEKKLKLITRHNNTNMHLYNSNGQIKKYNNVNEIFNEYYENRLKLYVKRKEYYLKVLANQLKLLNWKIKFIDYVITEKVIVFENKKAKEEEEVIQQVVDYGFPKLANDAFAKESDKTFNYITDLKLFALTPKRKAELQEQHDKKLDEYQTYQNTSVEQIWTCELDELEVAYDKWLKSMEDEDVDKDKKKNNKSKKTPNKKIQ